jgi:hypothetical protein
VNPVNDAPVISIGDVTGSITEGNPLTLTDAGSIAFTDVDLTDTPTALVSNTAVTPSAGLTLTGPQQTALEDAFSILPAVGNDNNGTINWDYTITEGELDFLGRRHR